MSKMIKFITVDEASKILGVSKHKAYDLGYTKKIGRYVNKHGGVGVRYNRAEVEEFKAEHGILPNRPAHRPGIAKLTKPAKVKLPDTKNTPIAQRSSVLTLVTPTGFKVIGSNDDVANFYNNINK